MPAGKHQWDVQAVVLTDMDRMMVGRECRGEGVSGDECFLCYSLTIGETTASI